MAQTLHSRQRKDRITVASSLAWPGLVAAEPEPPKMAQRMQPRRRWVDVRGHVLGPEHLLIMLLLLLALLLLLLLLLLLIFAATGTAQHRADATGAPGTPQFPQLGLIRTAGSLRLGVLGQEPLVPDQA